MNRLMIAAALSASSLLLVDSAVKGAALLLVALLAAGMLRRDSAATRHLVWTLAFVALLLAPALSALLPQWQILPGWAKLSPEPALVEARSPGAPGPAEPSVEFSNEQSLEPAQQPSATVASPAAARPDPQPTSAAPAAAPAVSGGAWLDLLPLFWGIGVAVLLLRLLAARLLLWNIERQGMIVWPLKRPAEASDDPLVSALEAARSQLGIGRPVLLLLHPARAIPVVWGIFRPRLLLPALARAWSAEQLRSVLLHELAHVKRRDVLVQLLAQSACALYWFNPLVWFAAWRLGVERERACDDLVLASGVRPSAYAGHLLDIVTRLTPAPRLQSCGLAVARKSSLEGRLGAVLSARRNRRRVSAALAVIALAIAVGIAVPLAMLRAAEEQSDAPVQQKGESELKTPPPTSKEGNRLPPDMEKQLRWGKAVNGLRSALILRPAPGELKPGELPILTLVLQNVSKAPLRLSDADVPAKSNLRLLYQRSEGRILWALGAREPRLGDVLLQPREVAFLPMFSGNVQGPDGQNLAQVIVEGMLKDTRQTLFAEMQIDQGPVGAWTGKLTSGDTSGAAAAGGPQPKNKAAQALFMRMQDDARANGDIPGGLMALLGDKVKEFIRNNKNDIWGKAHAQQLEQLEQLTPPLDASRDWKPAEAAKLLDDIAAVQTIPLETTQTKLGELALYSGQPLPKALSTAAWGEKQPCGLRMAWLLEPRAADYRLGTHLKSTILIHNAGKESVVFRAPSFFQSGQHKARDAKNADLKVDSVDWLTLSRFGAHRLAPGEYLTITAAGIGIGKDRNTDDWQNIRVGAWIETKAGDDVTFTPDAVDLSNWKEPPLKDGQPGWWPDFIAARLALEVPLPAMANDRTRLLEHVTRDLFGTAPTAEEAASFLADATPGAFHALVKRLAHRPGITPFSGSLIPGEIKFRVLPPDPDAAKRPRSVSNPGWYTLGDHVVLSVSRRPEGERIVNEASIRFFAAKANQPEPGKPYPLKLPDGYNTWAAAWLRDSTVLWVQQEKVVHGYDFSNPAQVKETTYEGAALQQVPQPIREALHSALEEPVPAASELPRRGRKNKGSP